MHNAYDIILHTTTTTTTTGTITMIVDSSLYSYSIFIGTKQNKKDKK